MKILLFSTTGTLIEQITATLCPLPYLLTIASTPSDAIKTVKFGSPQIIMLDLAAAELSQLISQLADHHHSQYRHARPAIVLLAPRLPADAKPPLVCLPAPLLSLGVHGFGEYDECNLPPILDILAQLQKPTLAEQSQKPTLIARTHRGDECIVIDDILFCQAEQKYTKIHHKYGTTLVDDTLKSLELAHPDALIRIHRHTLAGIRHIQAISHAHVSVCGVPTPLVISRRCQAKVRRQLAHFYQKSPKAV